jgi:hypothetical protein
LVADPFCDDEEFAREVEDDSQSPPFLKYLAGMSKMVKSAAGPRAAGKPKALGFAAA